MKNLFKALTLIFLLFPLMVSSNEVKDAQRLLTFLGYNVGTIDGIYGKKTELALKNFHSKLGEVYTGDITDEVLLRLREAYNSDKLVYQSAKNVAELNYSFLAGPEVNKPYILAAADLNHDGFDDLILGVNIWVDHQKSTKSKEYKKAAKPIILLYEPGSSDPLDGKYKIDPVVQSKMTEMRWSHRVLQGDFNNDSLTDYFITDTGPDNGPPCGGRGVLLIGGKASVQVRTDLLPKTAGYSHAANVLSDNQGDAIIEFNNKWQSDKNFCEGYVEQTIIDEPQILSFMPSGKLQGLRSVFEDDSEKYTKDVIISASTDLNDDQIADLVFISDMDKLRGHLLTTFANPTKQNKFGTINVQKFPFRFAGRVAGHSAVFNNLDGDENPELILSLAKKVEGQKGYQGNYIYVLNYDLAGAHWVDRTFDFFDEANWEAVTEHTPERAVTNCINIQFVDIDDDGDADLVCSIHAFIEDGLATDYMPRVWLREEEKFTPLFLDPNIFKYKSHDLTAVRLDTMVSLVGLEFIWDETKVILRRFDLP
jgi:hypothetical protein